MPKLACAWFLTLACLTAACAGSRTPPRPFPGAPPPPTAPPAAVIPEPALPPTAEGPAPVTPAATTPLVVPVVAMALGFQGVPYRNGGTDPSGFDCSGLVQYVFARHGLRLPREVRDQFRAAEPIDRKEIQPGDLVFFETVSRGASHVGIAIGGDEFVHAPSSRGVVRVERFTTDYWARRWVGARRVSGPPAV